ncbi:PKD domain-containing protein [Methanoplanus limicola]|nr:PKD domain-containing protein [Methanoplanus limicola]
MSAKREGLSQGVNPEDGCEINIYSKICQIFRKSKSQPWFFSGRDDALSDIIGGIVLTAVVVAGIGMMAVVLLSDVPPAEIPVLRVDLADSKATITLVHSGGDSVYREDARIMVDGVDRTDDFKLLTDDGELVDWNVFSTGDWLVSSIPRDAVEEVQLSSIGSEVPTVIQALVSQPVSVSPPPIVYFTFSPTSGYVPLVVSFTDLSGGDIINRLWDFGDNSTSTDVNPVHIYNRSGIFTVTLTLCNAAGCNSTTDNITVFGFDDFIVNESVFVYGNRMIFEGDNVVGDGSTIVITGDLTGDDLNGDAKVGVSNIYIEGSVELSGSQVLGNATSPGILYINGSLSLEGGSEVYGNNIYVADDVVLTSGNIYGNIYTFGSFDFIGGNTYGEVHTKGSLSLTSGNVHDDIYIDGDLTLGWTPTIDSGVSIYYTGSISHPDWYSQDILDKCHHVDSVPDFSMPGFSTPPIPSARLDGWYSDHGYVSGKNLYSGIKIFADSYKRTAKSTDSAENIVIVAKTGDIELNKFGGIPVTGVLFAPNGEVIFGGSSFESFEGVVIAKEGFSVERGGVDVTFRNIENYIPNRDDFPWSDSF